MIKQESSNCYYHPSNNSISSCEVCGKDFCVFDKRIYRKRTKESDSNSGYFTFHEYCKHCYASKIEKEFRNHVLSLTFIPLSIIVYITMYLSFYGIFVRFYELNIISLIIIIIITIVISSTFLNSYILRNQAINGLLDDAIDNKNTYCSFHKDIFATSICKNCHKLICQEDSRKINEYSPYEYCINCYNSMISKQSNALNLSGVITISVAVITVILFMVFTENYIFYPFFDQYTTIFIGFCFVLGLILGSILIRYKSKNSKIESEIVIKTHPKSNGISNDPDSVISLSSPLHQICNKCGSTIPPDSNKCMNCGEEIS